MSRDMSRAQFDAKLAQYGMKRTGFLGYVAVNDSLHVYPGNAGPSLRAQLAYLLAARERDEERTAALKAKHEGGAA